jgi:diguanylate cyclase (GGDEF)-like protein
MDSLERQAVIVRKFFDRRISDFFKGIRHQRAAIAERLSSKGLGASGAFVSEVTAAYEAGFENFARGLMAETFDLLKRSGITIDSQVSSWITAQLDPLFTSAAKHVCGEANGTGVLGPELKESVQRALNRCLAAIRRDLQVDLDLALVTKEIVQPVDAAFLDPLVALQNRRGLEREFDLLTKASNDPISLAFFDVDHFKDVNDEKGGHAIGNEALTSIAEMAAACVRGKGQGFRVGGDEFALLLPNHQLEEGLAVAERFRREVNGASHTSRQLTLSVSVGVAQWPQHGNDLDSAVLSVTDTTGLG